MEDAKSKIEIREFARMGSGRSIHIAVCFFAPFPFCKKVSE